MTRVIFEKDGIIYGGCYSKDEAMARILFALTHDGKNIEWSEVPYSGY